MNLDVEREEMFLDIQNRLFKLCTSRKPQLAAGKTDWKKMNFLPKVQHSGKNTGNPAGKQ